jgi:hypothetical protein
MTDQADGYTSTDDDDLPISITHSRDVIAFGGRVEQDYRFLVYRFRGAAGEVVARTYLDEIWTVSITEPLVDTAVPHDVLQYLQKRFTLIQQLGGPDGYTRLWSKED